MYVSDRNGQQSTERLPSFNNIPSGIGFLKPSASGHTVCQIVKQVLSWLLASKADRWNLTEAPLGVWIECHYSSYPCYRSNETNHQADHSSSNSGDTIKLFFGLVKVKDWVPSNSFDEGLLLSCLSLVLNILIKKVLQFYRKRVVNEGLITHQRIQVFLSIFCLKHRWERPQKCVSPVTANCWWKNTPTEIISCYSILWLHYATNFPEILWALLRIQIWH